LTLVNAFIFLMFFLPLLKLVVAILASVNVIEAIKNLAERK
jgi:hypothetical protein